MERKLTEDKAYQMIGRIESKSTAKEKSIASCELAHEAEVDVSERTIRRRLHEHDYPRYVACRKGYIADDLSKHRLASGRYMLAKYST